jgi:integrase
MGVSIECQKCGYKQRDYSDLCKACKDQKKENGLALDPGICRECKTVLCKKCNTSLKAADKVFWIDYYDGNGRRHRKKISSQRSLADIALKDIKVKIAKGEYLGIYEEKKTLFKDFAEKYLKMITPNVSPTSFERFEGIVNNHLIPSFQCYLYKISKKQIQEYIQKRAEEVKPATVNHEMKRLRHMLNKAVEWGYLKENPCKGVKNLKEPPGRIRYITPEELEALLKACEVSSLAENPNNKGRTFSKLLTVFLKPVVLTAIHTGARRSEILSLRWKDIDFTQRRIMFEVTKNGERRMVPMNDTVYEVLRSLPVHLGSDLVFPGIDRLQLTMAFRRAIKRAGIEDFKLHDCRHSFASYVTMSGESLRTVQVLLGHKDLRMTMRYAHLSPEHLREAVSKLDKSLNLIPSQSQVETVK